MKISAEVNNGTFEVALSERMAFSDHSAFRSMLDRIKASGAKSAVFNLSELTSVDSAGLGMFMIALEASERDGWALKLSKPQGNVRQLLQLAKIDKLIPVQLS